MHVDSSLLVIENQQWNLDDGNFIGIDSSTVIAKNLFFNNGTESVSIEGSVSKKKLTG